MTDPEAFVAAYMAACEGYPKNTMRFAADLWQAATHHERSESRKLADALMALLGDTQHAKHPSCTDGGYCPVRDAREALEAFQERIKA